MDIIPKKIGEGGYGCIHYPNLTCENLKTYSRSNMSMLSKILKTKHAKIEKHEYNHMNRSDPHNKYYLGDPVQCKIAKTKENFEAIRSCDEGSTILKDLDNYSLLLMNYGGLNLKEYGKEIETWDATPANRKKIERFWLECHRLLRGVKMLLNHGLIHSDFKPHNIVYDEKKKRLNFIDFGLMQTIDSTLREISEDKYGNIKCHFSHPFETHLLSKSNYSQFMTKSASQKEEYYQNWIQDVEMDETECGKKINDFFAYMFTNSDEDKEIKRTILEGYIAMLRKLPRVFDKWDYMRTLKTFDIYGIGFTYLYMLKCSKHLITLSFYYDMRDLFIRMISGNAFERIQIEDCLQEYEYILLNHGILSRFRVHFEHHAYVNGVPKNTKPITNLINRLTFSKSINKKRISGKDQYASMTLKMINRNKRITQRRGMQKR